MSHSKHTLKDCHCHLHAKWRRMAASLHCSREPSRLAALTQHRHSLPRSKNYPLPTWKPEVFLRIPFPAVPVGAWPAMMYTGVGFLSSGVDLKKKCGPYKGVEARCLGFEGVLGFGSSWFPGLGI